MLKRLFAGTRLPKALVVAAACAFLCALVLPFFRLIPDVGDRFLRELLEIVFGDPFDTKSYSVLGGIRTLYSEGGWDNWVIGSVLLVFSVIFPSVKLLQFCLMLWGRKGRSGVLAEWLTVLGPWSMADVFVVSVTVIAFKSFPGNTRIGVAIGYYFFLASVLLTMAAAHLAKRHRPLEFDFGVESQKPIDASTQGETASRTP